MMEFIGFLVILTIFLITIGAFIWSMICLLEAFDEDFRTERMARWNLFKWIISGASTLWNAFVTAATWKPKTGIDKEIEAEEKEIEELEQQKEKINKLHRLKRRKEELFKQVEGDS